MDSSINISLQEFFETLYGDAPGVITATSTGDAFPCRPYHRRRLRGVTHGCVGVFGDARTAAGNISRGRSNCVGVRVLQLDDVGTKSAVPSLDPTAILETSPGNFTYLYRLEETVEPTAYEAATRGLAQAGYGDPNCTDPTRLYRVPGSQPPGKEHVAQLIAWRPTLTITLDEIMAACDAEEVVSAMLAASEAIPGEMAGDDEVAEWLSGHGMIAGEDHDGWLRITCPWAHLHTDDRSIAKYKPATDADIRRAFHCHHTHGHNTTQFLAWVAEQGGPDVDALAHVERDWSELARLVGATGRDAIGGPAWARNGLGGRGAPPRLADVAAPERVLNRVTPAAMARPEHGDAGEDRGAAPEEDGDEVAVDVFAAIGPLLDVNREALPDLRASQNGISELQYATPANMAYVFDVAGVVKRFNMMLGEVEWSFDGPLGYFNEMDNGMKLSAIQQAASLHGITSATGVDRYCDAAQAERYHPMEEWLQSLPHQGDGHIAGMTSTWPVEPGDLSEADSRVYVDAVVRRWMIQVVQCVRGWRAPVKQTPHVLVFSGRQGAGKTSWFQNISPFGMVGGVLHFGGGVTGDRDAVIRATSAAIVELGELDTTFSRSEQGALKNFLSTTEDKYRPPYGRHTLTVRRTTAFGATVNQPEILRDVTGNRRYWPIAIAGDIPPPENIEAMWAEANAAWEAGESWFLTEDERDLHAVACALHMDVSDVDDLMAKHFPVGFLTLGKGYERIGGARVLTVTAIQQIIDNRTPRSRDLIRAYVRRNGGEWGKHTDPEGRRIGNSCLAPPSATHSL